MKIALALGPDASAVSTFGTQCGVEHAVGTFGLKPIPDKPIADEAQPFSRQSLSRLKAQYEKNGYQLSVIESRPPMEKIKLAQPGRDEEIAVICEFIRNMGAVGIPVWCPAWMPILFVIRTSSEIPTRGGAKVTGFDLEEFNKTHPAGEHGEVTEEDQWDNLKYFLERVVPVAEEANVKLAMHPDDPPLSPIQGIARIISSVENYQKMVDLVPSPANGIGLCQGNFGLMTDDLPSVIRHFGRAAEDPLRPFPRHQGHAGEVRRGLPRRRQARHGGLCQGLSRHGVRGSRTPRPFPAANLRRLRRCALDGASLRHWIHEGPDRGGVQRMTAELLARRRSQVPGCDTVFQEECL